MHTFNRIRVWVHVVPLIGELGAIGDGNALIAVTCQITLKHPSIRRRCALCQITLTTCYLWTRPLRQSHR